MVEFLYQNLYSCYFLASVSGLLILSDVVSYKHGHSVIVYIVIVYGAT